MALQAFSAGGRKTVLEGSTNLRLLPGLTKILTFLLLVTHSDVKGSLSWC